MKNLLDYTQSQLAEFFVAMGEKPFRAKQLMRWIHHYGVRDIEQMTDIAKGLRAKLAEQTCIQPPSIQTELLSDDGTRKWLIAAGDGNAVETVFIPEQDRGTLCVSSQVGCALACTFCSTGRQGFNRNLSVAEIIGQLWVANASLRAAPDYELLSHDDRIISNVVMMGMGEPLQNYAALVPALRTMLDDHAYGLSRRRVTVSTSGVVPMMDRLAQDCPVALAVSLHAPLDDLRDALVPINRKYPIAELLDACRRYLPAAPRDFITFEYCMLDGVNDQPEHAQALIDLVRPKRAPSKGVALAVPCKFNLIPFNPFPASGLTRSDAATVKAFAAQLSEAGIVTTVRKTRGDDIDAACGQLAGDVKDRTNVDERIAKQRVIPLTQVPL